MATRRRTNVPPMPADGAGNNGDGFADDAGQGVELFGPADFPALDLYRESGDLQALSDASFNDWSWVVYRIKSADEMARERSKHQRVFVTKLSGPLDVLELQRICGGGLFEIRGFFGNTLRTLTRQEFAGPARTYGVQPSPNQSVADHAPAAPVASAEIIALRRIARRQAKQLEALTGLVQNRLAAPVAPAAPVVDPMAQLNAVLEVADRIHGRTNPAPESNVLNEVVGAFRKGMELRGEIEGAPEKTTTETLLEKGLPMVERLLGGLLASRARAGARPAPPPPPAREPSSAAVLPDTPAGAPPAPPPVANPPAPADSGDHRWTTAVEALARAIEAGEDPRDFAITLEAILRPDEIGLVVLAPADQVLNTLRQRAGAAFPVLNTDAALPFVVAVKTALADGDEDEDDEDGDGSGVG